MNPQPQPPSSTEGGAKKAVHVKWAGKTIALGTFTPAEADEKCARAKALTRAWRSTIRPLPSREWVMMELERLGVRVVSNKLGRKAASHGGDEEDRGMGQSAGADRKDSLGLAAAHVDIDRFMRRRSSSLGFSSLDDNEMKQRSGSLGLGRSAGIEETVMPPHRPLVGGASAAAYEAARADHYSRLATDQARRSSSLGMGSPSLPGSGPVLPGNSSQHYEMLKLHHMNLLNEIQETTLMMNLYQQQQLQQEQELLRRERLQQEKRLTEPAGVAGVNSSRMSTMLTRQQPLGMEPMYSGSGMASDYVGQPKGIGGLDTTSFSRIDEIGVGINGAPGGLERMQGTMNQQQIQSGMRSLTHTTEKEKEPLSEDQEQILVEERLQRIKDEIARRQREVDELEAAAALTQQPMPDESTKAKRRRSEDEREIEATPVKSNKKTRQREEV